MRETRPAPTRRPTSGFLGGLVLAMACGLIGCEADRAAVDPGRGGEPASEGEGEGAVEGEGEDPAEGEGEGPAEGEGEGAAEGEGEGATEGEGEDPGIPAVDFDPGPYGVGFRDIAGPFEARTLTGRWDFEAEWDGRSSYVFYNLTNDPRQPEQLVQFLEGFWFPGGDATREIRDLIAESPQTVTYVFGSFDSDAEADVRRMKGFIDGALSRLPDELADHWRDRFRFISEPLSQVGGWLSDVFRSNGWLWFGIDHAQRFRQLGSPTDMRNGVARLSMFAHEARLFEFERRRRARMQAEEGVEIVTLWHEEMVNHAIVDVDFPSAEEMEGFDTMEYDLSAFCPEHLDANCGEWDRLSHLAVCDVPAIRENANAETECQPRVPAVLAVEEALGTCDGVQDVIGACSGFEAVPGVCAGSGAQGVCEGLEEEMGECSESGDECRSSEECPGRERCRGYFAAELCVEDHDCGRGGTCLDFVAPMPCVFGAACAEGVACEGATPPPACTGDEDCADVPGVEASTCEGYVMAPRCTADDDCGEGLPCVGYVAPSAEIAEIPADVLACDCIEPFGEALPREQVCNAEGTGYGDCPCGCGWEVGRWVTTYGREGRWLTDASPMLAFFQRGGHQRLRIDAGNTKWMTFEVRLSNRGKGARPTGAKRIFGGGGFNPSYNANREPILFDVPDGTVRVDLAALITGHGWGVEMENCAEFCNHTHHFTFNGDEVVKRHDLLDTADGRSSGCLDQVDVGVVPNQYGTWPFGRAGWCPGLDVPPWVVDVTDSLRPTGNEVTYRGLFQGADYEPRPRPNPPGGFGANINMASYLIFWE